MNADRLLSRLGQVTRILADEELELGERTARLYRLLFERPERRVPFHADAPRPAHLRPAHLPVPAHAISGSGSNAVGLRTETDPESRWRELTADCSRWDSHELDSALQSAKEVIVRYTELYYDPSLLHVTYYRRQRRISAFLDQLLSPLLKEHVARTGRTDEPDLFLNEPIFFFKKEVRTRAYPKDKHGRVDLALMRERFRLLLMNRTAA